MNEKKINPRIARWALELKNFDYEVRHRKGDQMAPVDALSRAALVCACAIDGSDVDLNIQISQSRDNL